MGWVGLDSSQGTYDLTVLDDMEGAFPPKRTTNNIYRDNRHDKNSSSSNGGRNKGPMDFGETRDSLDHLAGSPTDRQRLSRCVYGGCCMVALSSHE